MKRVTLDSWAAAQLWPIHHCLSTCIVQQQRAQRSDFLHCLAKRCKNFTNSSWYQPVLGCDWLVIGFSETGVTSKEANGLGPEFSFFLCYAGITAGKHCDESLYFELVDHVWR